MRHRMPVDPARVQTGGIVIDMAAIASASASIPVKISNVTPGAVGIWTLLAVVLVALIKAWPALAKIANEGDASLRTALLTRITNLEGELADERRECARKLELMSQEILTLSNKVAKLERDAK